VKFNSFVYPFNKQKYVKGKKPDTDCILCSVINNKGNVQSLIVAETASMAISVNLYPYNSGHIFIFQKRHVLDIRELTESEEKELSFLIRLFISILEELYQPSGFNIGYNMGKYSGASIGHIHQHIIPRYSNELGVIDVIGGARVMIENPVTTRKKLKKKVKEYIKNHNKNENYGLF
jgi:ATP adenylyltransferase